MCGIIGCASQTPLIDRAWITVGRDAMHHRGPDDAGEWWSPDRRVGLGHQRLAIIDLTPTGHQPMHDSSGASCIVFNGEIYNFMDLRQELISKGQIFRSHSDTEVILGAYIEWGTDCLSRLNGMFTFAIYDNRKQQLFLARDRAGEKPLFYTNTKGILRFASELKCLMTDPGFPRRINPEALDCYLAMGFVPGERCIIQDVKKIPPAHSLVFDLNSGKLRLWCYWQLPNHGISSDEQVDEENLLEELENLLEDSVRRQLVADVPVGVLLSGGVDSSLITALAVRADSKIRTFTIRFPGYGKYDETEHARLIANYFGTEHMELEAEESTIDMLPILAKQFDEPIVDSSMIPTYLLSSLVRKHCTVALGGDGGDELFGGYRHYSRLRWAEQKLGWAPRSFRLALANAAEVLLPLGYKGRRWLQNFEIDIQEGLPLTAKIFDRTTRRHLMSGHGTWDLVAEAILKQSMPKADDLLQRATRLDFTNYLAEDILVKIDRASMLCSLEVRSPLLDYRLIEFAFGKIPIHLKASVTSRKILLKKLAARLLPPEFDQNRKQGFSIPLSQWLQSGPWLKYFKEVLLDTDNFFDRKTVESLLQGQIKGRANSERLFSLVLFELWRREYGTMF